MRKITKENGTRAVWTSFQKMDDQRLRFVVDKLVKHLHSFATTTQLTRAEWQADLPFLRLASDISCECRTGMPGDRPTVT